MKKLLLTAAILAASAGAANAEINVGIGINQPAYPVYVAPAPTVVYYNEHRNYDWNYWHPADRRVVVERRYVDYDRDDRHHGRGHGKAKGHYKH